MMSFRSFLAMGGVAALAACQPAIPDSGAGIVDPGRGVGFDNPNTLAEREARAAELSSSTVPAAPSVGAQTLPPASASAGSVPASTAAATANTSATRTTSRAVSDPQGLDAELAQIARQNDATAAQDEARSLAMKEATARAELYASAAGFKVARNVSISESSGYSGPQPMEMAMSRMSADAAPTPIASGEVSYSATVNVVFELKK